MIGIVKGERMYLRLPLKLISTKERISSKMAYLDTCSSPQLAVRFGVSGEASCSLPATAMETNRDVTSMTPQFILSWQYSSH